MRVHHLNGATLCPLGGQKIVCHLLLIESDKGLILVDTGLGLEDCQHPGVRLGRIAPFIIRPALDPEETAFRQLRRLGFQSTDVRHIVVTHLDLDHAGGLADFPEAHVHLQAIEHGHAIRQAAPRYRTAQWSHGPRWVSYGPGGDTWKGFSGVQALKGVSDDILLVPLSGHSPGHQGIAVRMPDGWLFHAGDSYYHHRQVIDGHCPLPTRLFERWVAHDNQTRIVNLRRLRALAQDSEVQVFCAHDPVAFARLSGR